MKSERISTHKIQVWTTTIEVIEALVQQTMKQIENPNPDQLLTKQEIATLLCVSIGTIENWQSKGFIVAHPVRRKRYYKLNQFTFRD
jgi:hypothetical protein